MNIDVEAKWADQSIGRKFSNPAEFGSFIEALAVTAVKDRVYVQIVTTIGAMPPIEIHISGDLL